ncbi:MAG: hypothetical protein RR459_03835, partial [Christensenellaceae bacterium]
GYQKNLARWGKPNQSEQGPARSLWFFKKQVNAHIASFRNKYGSGFTQDNPATVSQVALKLKELR